MTNGEQKIDAVAGEIAQIAGAAAEIPSPASPALLLFSEIEPIIGPEIVSLFGKLFHRIKGAKNPKAAAEIVVKTAHVQMDVVGNIDPDGEGKDV